MASRLANICFDSADPIGQARWWDQVLDDFSLEPDDQLDDECAGLEGVGGRWLLFLRVPERKTVKNRAHLCLRASDRTMDEEVERLLGLGATMFDDRRGLEDGGWVVLADPEGNEFCVLRAGADEVGISKG